MKEKKSPSVIRIIAVNYILVNLLASLAVLVLMIGAAFLMGNPGGILPESLYRILDVVLLIVPFAVPCAGIFLWYRRKREQVTAAVPVTLAVILLAAAVLFTILMYLADGSIGKGYVYYTLIPLFPFLPMMIFAIFGAGIVPVMACAFLLFELICALIVRRKKPSFKLLVPVAAVLVVLTGLNVHMYENRPEIRYSGHGFDYMNGYSSTDFTDYMVFSDAGKLAQTDEPVSLQITEDMPVMDGAEACYPLYAAVAKAVYPGIEDIEREYFGQESQGLSLVEDGGSADEAGKINGSIVQFSNTVIGYERLINGEVDLFFGARPSAEQLKDAEEAGVELEITPIGREAFVFFVEEDNPVDSLTAGQIREIYSGEIVNWKEVGGTDQEIVAFQRPANSGSQTMMQYFMGDTALAEPKTYEVADAMAGVIKEVAEYANEKGAMGYTFRYFLEGLNQEKGVKLLQIDGTAPTVENLKNGLYPAAADLCLVTVKDDGNPNVRAMIDFMLSEQGQELVEKTGYAPLGR